MLSIGLSLPLSASNTERLLAEVPDGWIKGVDKQLAALTVSEYFPPDTEEYWQQKLSYEVMTGEHLPDPIEYAEGLAEQQEKYCEDFKDNTVFAGFENGYPTMVHLLNCGKNTRTFKPIVTMVKAIKGHDALYVITRIWRLEPPPPQLAEEQTTVSPLPQEELAGWSQVLRRIKLCNSALDAHPCQ